MQSHPHFRRFTAVSQPFELVGIDILGPLPMTADGNRYLILFTDYLSKWVEGVAIPNQMAKTIARAFISEVIACTHGVPQTLITDWGTNFPSETMESVHALLGIRISSTTPLPF